MKNIKELTVSASVVGLSLAGGLSGQALAAGSASLAMSPSGGSSTVGSTFPVTISENSGSDTVNVVEADLSYDTSKLQLAGVSCNTSAFEVTAPGGNGITCGTSTPKSGGQVLGIVNFKVLAAGPTNISFAPSSHIYRSTDNADIWNGSPSGASYNLAAAPVVSRPVYRAPVTSAASTPAPTTASTTPSNQKAAAKSKKAAAKPATALAKKANSHLSAWIYVPIGLIAAAAGIAYVFRDQYNQLAAKTKKNFRATANSLKKRSLVKAFQRS